MHDSKRPVSHLLLQHVATRPAQPAPLLALSFLSLLAVQGEGGLLALVGEDFVDGESVCLGEDFSVFGLGVELGRGLL